MKLEAKKIKIETSDNGIIHVFTDDDITESCVEQLINLKPGTIFKAGDIRFVVLEHGQFGTKVIEANVRPDRVFDEDTPNWAASELRNHLNTEVFKEYEAIFGHDNIIESETDLTTLDGLKNYGSCMDNIRLLTFEEYRKYQQLFDREDKWEWTCTPWSIKERGWEYSICVVSPRGLIDDDDCYYGDAVRPFCILKSNIFVSLEEKADE